MRNIKKYATNKGYEYKVTEEFKGFYSHSDYTVVEVTTDKTTYKITHFKRDTTPYVVEIIEDAWNLEVYYFKTQKEICERITGMEFLKNR